MRKRKKLNLSESLKEILGEGLIYNMPMSKVTSFKTGGPAELFLSPKNEAQLKESLERCKEFGAPITIFGNATNVLVSDKGIKGATISLAGIKGLSCKQDNTIKAMCGVSMAELSRFAYENSLCGTEFCSGIPGSVGGGVYMNAGAYGAEMKDILVSVKSINDEGNLITRVKDELGLDYRKSVFTNLNEIILCADVQLSKGNKEDIRNKMHELNMKRKEKQPLNYPSAGSTFKRPQGYYAAALIEQAGLKGRKIGGAMVSEKHAGFIINYGGATSSDILALIEVVREEVLSRFNVELEPEIKYVGIS